jgi:hypothetical protein
MFLEPVSSGSWLSVDWDAVVALGTIIASIAALIAVLQTRKKSQQAVDSERADVSAWIEENFDANELREGRDLVVNVRNDSRSQVRLEMLIFRPRFIHHTSLIDPSDAFVIAALRRRDPLVWEPEGSPLAGRGAERSIRVPARSFDKWTTGEKSLFDEIHLPARGVSPWVSHLVIVLVFSDNMGQVWARLGNGSLKKLRDTQSLYDQPLKRLLPDR